MVANQTVHLARTEVCHEIFGSKYFLQMGQTKVFQYEPDSKKQSIEWKHPDSQVKKNFRVQWSVKKAMQKVFWDMKRPITIDFHEKGTTVNSANLPTLEKITLFIEWPSHYYYYL